MRRHCRGKRAGRAVRERQHLARHSDHQHRPDYDRALIPLAGPGLAPGIGDSTAAQTRDRPGLTAGGRQEGSGSESSRRIESFQSPESSIESKYKYKYDRVQLLAIRDRLDRDAVRGATETIRRSLPGPVSPGPPSLAHRPTDVDA